MQYIYTNKQQAMDPRVKPEDNGFLPADQPFITADDRSFRFGDGIFETMLVVGGRMWDAPAHFARLREGLAFFRLALDTSQLPAICEALIAKNNLVSGYVRIVVSRGNSGALVGYMPANNVPYFVVQTVAKPFPAYQQLTLTVSQQRASMQIPCKVNSALLYTMAMMEARDAGCDNALILDTHGHVCETASGNIFWVKDGVLYTPELSLPFVPGTVRKKIIEHSPLLVKEGRYTLADLAKADEIFMTNVGTLVAGITSIQPLGYISTESMKIQEFRAILEGDIYG